MNITVKRIAKRASYTIGKMYIDGKYFCDTCEDTDRGLTQYMSTNEIRRKKIHGKTAIPSGTYKVDMNTISPKYNNPNRYFYVKKYKAKMPRLLNVPGFSGILLHAGTTAADTDGCILVGENSKKGMVLNSQKTWTKLMDILLTDKENITLTIQ